MKGIVAECNTAVKNVHMFRLTGLMICPASVAYLVVFPTSVARFYMPFRDITLQQVGSSMWPLSAAVPHKLIAFCTRDSKAASC